MSIELIEYSLHCLEGLNKEERTEQVEEMIQDHIDTIRECHKKIVAELLDNDLL